MSVKIDNVTTSSIGNAIVGTALLTDSSILAASTAFVNNVANNLNLALNQVLTYTIAGIKTISGNFTLVAGTSVTSNTTIGTVNATTIDIFPSTQGAASITINALAQPMQSSLVANSWSIPIVIAPAQNSATPYTRIQSGVITSSSLGSVHTFATPFTLGCIPRLFIVSQTTTGLNATAFNVSRGGFAAWVNNAGNVTCSWFALGY